MRWLDSITNSMDMKLSQLQEIAEDRGAWQSTVHRVIDLVTEQPQQITHKIITIIYKLIIVTLICLKYRMSGVT